MEYRPLTLSSLIAIRRLYSFHYFQFASGYLFPGEKHDFWEMVYIDRGEADLILCFERLEAARWLPWLRKGGRMIVNDQRIDPMPVITGAMSYPDDILARLRALGADVTAVDALGLACQAGSAKAANVVLLGVLSADGAFPEEA